jgi:hypothetical protein
MGVRNTTQADVYFNGVKVAKCREISFPTQNTALDTTGIGEFDATSDYGLRSTTATATILYDPEDAATVALMNRIRRNQGTLDTLRLVSKRGSTQGDVSGDVVITSMNAPVQVGELMSAQISMNVSGGLTGEF